MSDAPASPAPPPGKRLAVFLDGTWNDPQSNTNVWRLKLMTAAVCPRGVPQLVHYDTGVGTGRFDRIRGGAFAKGLSKNVREAYGWLMEHYDPGDRVFVFGFSRGAFTARSLTGLIAKCGLLRPGAPLSVGQVFDRYARPREELPLYRLEYFQRHPDRMKQQLGRDEFTLEERWLLDHSVRIPIRFIGVWDTVGTLGLPVGRIPGVSRSQFRFHHTRLSKIFEHACQALAIDEHRKPYRPTPWTSFTPFGEEDDAQAEAETAEQKVEQRWFIGAHANVGGGYRDDPLAQIPLAWIQQRAHAAGLHFRVETTLRGDEQMVDPVDSFRQFLKGLYRAVRLGRRYYRPIGAERVKKERGWVETVNETIDPTVLDRWRKDPGYRPANLVEWAGRAGVDLSAVPVDVLRVSDRLTGA